MRAATSEVSSASSAADAPSSEDREFRPTGRFGERVCQFTCEPEVTIHINAPAVVEFTADRPVLLIFYALPNGNTIAQTIGRQLKPGDDWHFDIQHIGAQTRFLRQLITNRTVVTAYLEARPLSWPAWRKKHGDGAIPAVVDAVKKLFPSNRLELLLTGHSGGGSFIFGYINAVRNIPDEIARIALLDSNYAYDRAAGHAEKLTRWLAPVKPHYLCVLAYNDAAARLDGKPFASAQGGTWGRSHAMLDDFKASFQFKARTNAAGLKTYSALDGRLQFLLQENPDRKILHTIQVERNGFIHSAVSGTPNENRGYEYFGPRAYAHWILPE